MQFEVFQMCEMMFERIFRAYGNFEIFHCREKCVELLATVALRIPKINIRGIFEIEVKFFVILLVGQLNGNCLCCVGAVAAESDGDLSDLLESTEGCIVVVTCFKGYIA